MAKSVEDFENEIREIDAKIKTLEIKRKDIRGKIQAIHDRDVFELAKQIRAAGKIEEVRRLVEADPAKRTPTT